MVQCEQCGYTHPPVVGRCPMAKVQLSQDELNIESGMADLTIQLKNILFSQCQKKQIKDAKKLSTYVIVEIMKLLEAYKE